MLGLELNYKGEKITATIDHGVMTIIVTRLLKGDTDSINLDFNGLDTSGDGDPASIQWYTSKLSAGDELLIRVVDVAASTEPADKPIHK